MKRDDTLLLNQLVKSLEECLHRLERFYEKKEYDEFNKIKKEALKLIKQISELTK